MNKEDIIRMAREAGSIDSEEVIETVYSAFAEYEREECAKACEDAIASIWEFHPEYVNEVGRNVCTNLAAAIRARSSL